MWSVFSSSGIFAWICFDVAFQSTKWHRFIKWLRRATICENLRLLGSAWFHQSAHLLSPQRNVSITGSFYSTPCSNLLALRDLRELKSGRCLLVILNAAFIHDWSVLKARLSHLLQCLSTDTNSHLCKKLIS